MGGNTRARFGDDVVIEANGLERTFGEVVAVDGIDLAVTRGEVFGFLGPNGAGKSTTVRMLTTLLRPTGGTARIGGHDVEKSAADVRRIIGVALQDASIDPLMTGNELMRLQAVLHGISRSESRSRGAELLARVGLTGAAGRRVATYSGGMGGASTLPSRWCTSPASFSSTSRPLGWTPLADSLSGRRCAGSTAN